MTRTSEFVSLGHPDKIADYISSYLLDEYLRRDPLTRYAVEVQVKDNWVSLAGEVTSRAVFTPDEIAAAVRQAVRDIGYTHEYAAIWGAENTMDANALDVCQHIGQQSPDISQGVDRNGWGDQGIFWGMACRETADGMPKDYEIAARLGRRLYEQARDCCEFGLDIKTQVTMTDGRVREVVAAVPCLTPSQHETVCGVVRDYFPFEDCDFVVNGTGRYVRHAAQGDCGTTGRKLAVDFYGGNCRIGGGSPWTKDGSKADVALNLLARHYALICLKSHAECEAVYCSIACCIGQTNIRVSWYDQNMREMSTEVQSCGVYDVSELLHLREPIYASLCKNGLFSMIK